MPAPRALPPRSGQRIIICDYNQLLQSVTGLLRMSGYVVFQAFDGLATVELSARLPDIDLLILNTFGTGVDLPELIHQVRDCRPGMPVLHIGDEVPPDLPVDVPTIQEKFTPEYLLMTVAAFMPGAVGLGQPS